LPQKKKSTGSRPGLGVIPLSQLAKDTLAGLYGIDVSAQFKAMGLTPGRVVAPGSNKGATLAALQYKPTTPIELRALAKLEVPRNNIFREKEGSVQSARSALAEPRICVAKSRESTLLFDDWLMLKGIYKAKPKFPAFHRSIWSKPFNLLITIWRGCRWSCPAQMALIGSSVTP
jgi:hypothetical protein